MQPLAITSLTNPRLKALIRLQDHKERRETGLFVAEGSRAVSRALAAIPIGLACASSKYEGILP